MLAVRRARRARRSSCRSPAPARCASSSCATASASACTTARAASCVPPTEITLHARHHLQRDRGARQGSGGAAAVPRHAERHGAADPAPPGRGAAKPKPTRTVMQLRAERARRRSSRKTLRAALRDPRRRAAAGAGGGRRDPRRARASRLHRARGARAPSRGFDWSELAHAAQPACRCSATRSWSSCASPPASRARTAARRSQRYCERPEPRQRCSWSRCRGSTGRRPGRRLVRRARSRPASIVEIRPVERARAARLDRRAPRRARSRARPREVLDFLADRVEGNLLAAHQEIQKLALLAPGRARRSSRCATRC